MTKKKIIELKDGNAIKAFFSIRKSLDELNNLNIAEVARAISVEEVYDLTVELFEILYFLRRNSESRRSNSPSMRAVTPSQDNPGGLVKIYTKLPLLPISEAEDESLFRISAWLSRSRAEIKKGSSPSSLIDTESMTKKAIKTVEDKVLQSMQNVRVQDLKIIRLDTGVVKSNKYWHTKRYKAKNSGR